MGEQAKHTPGPWKTRIEGTRTGRGPVIYVDEIYDDGSTDEREIAELETSETRQSLARHPRARWRRRPDAAEIEANAKLIAAAPELLGAAVEAIVALDAISPGDHRKMKALSLLRTAIKEAAGK